MACSCISVFEHDRLEYARLPEQCREQLFTWLVDELVPRVMQDKNSPNWVSLRYKGGKTVSVQFHNYVGVIATPFGVHIEILPKSLKTDNVAQGRRLLLDMLCCLREFRYIVTEQALVQTEHLPLLEIFTGEFLQATLELVKGGLRNAYVPEEDNLPTLRGRLAITDHLRRNIGRKDRFYVRYDEFSPDRAENRLLHAALLKCRAFTAVHSNLARQLCDYFEAVPRSTNVALDLRRVHLERDMHNYTIPLSWARLLLADQSPVGGLGDFLAPSLLFPMEELFEAFVAHKLQGMFADGLSLRTQACNCCLLTYQNEQRFWMKPDMLVKNRNGENVLVLDTKWKIINENDKKFGISQADLYQLYAYGQAYLGGKGELALIYPKTETFQKPTRVLKLVDSGGTNFGKLRLWAIPFVLEPKNYKLILDGLEKDAPRPNILDCFTTTQGKIPE